MANVRLRGSYPGGRSFRSRYVKGSTISKQESLLFSTVHNTTTLSLQLDFREEERGDPHDRVILQFHKEVSVAVAVKKGEPSHRISGDLDKGRVILSLLLKAMITGRLCSNINYEQ